jgi:glucose-6-phosphate 1-dehydrogenase
MADEQLEATSRIAEGLPPCDVEVPRPFCLVIFGASGDLTRRKILPAVYRLFINKLLPDDFFVLGTARTEMGENEFREMTRESIKDAIPDTFSEDVWQAFAKRLHYRHVDYKNETSYQSMAKTIEPLEKTHKTLGNRMFYLAVPPPVYEPVILNLGKSGLAREEACFRHIVIEKPFGHDLESAKRLNAILRESFKETQVYRMDHYLAKETVQNILMFRFANSIFEPLWNNRFIDHVQITVSETLGVEHRAGYYEKAGVIRDMFQNHIFQLLALTAMEPPSVFEADRVRDEKVKVFRSMRPFPMDRLGEHVVVGQYGGGEIDGRAVPAYREEPGVAPNSATPTFAAMKVFINNWRWKGVPFYLRSGKRLGRRKAEVSIPYKQVPHLMFSRVMEEEEIEPNVLVLRVQPEEGINLSFQTKNPGSKVCLNPVLMDFLYPKGFTLDSYERVLLDSLQGDQMLFVREDGVHETWARLTPVNEKLESEAVKLDFPNYKAGSEGPEEAGKLIENDGRRWRPL